MPRETSTELTEWELPGLGEQRAGWPRLASPISWWEGWRPENSDWPEVTKVAPKGREPRALGPGQGSCLLTPPPEQRYTANFLITNPVFQ